MIGLPGSQHSKWLKLTRYRRGNSTRKNLQARMLTLVLSLVLKAVVVIVFGVLLLAKAIALTESIRLWVRTFRNGHGTPSEPP